MVRDEQFPKNMLTNESIIPINRGVGGTNLFFFSTKEGAKRGYRSIYLSRTYMPSMMIRSPNTVPRLTSVTRVYVFIRTDLSNKGLTCRFF
jgi:hypothetical protein